MSFHCRSAILLFCLPLLAAQERKLRVCADPNNLPFSNEAGEGIENRLAELLAHDMHAQVEYTWWAERKSFLKNSLGAGLCDVVMGVPPELDTVSATRPYYTSTYVFVERQDRGLKIASLNDPRLQQLRIGIHLVGENYAPPAHLLATRGIARQLIGYRLIGSVGEANPPARLIEAVAHGDVDVAIVWGPFAGYFAKGQDAPLAITPVTPSAFMQIPFTYGIAVAVRKGDNALRTEIETVMARNCKKIDALVSEFGIPKAREDSASCDVSQPSVASSH